VVYFSNADVRTLSFNQGQKVLFTGQFVNDSTHGPELKVSSAANATNISSGHAVAPEALSISQALLFTEIGSYVRVAGVVEGYTPGGKSFRISSGDVNITVYDNSTDLNFSGITFLANGTMVSVEGVVAYHSSVGNEIKLWMNSQIVEIQGANLPPSIAGNITQTPSQNNVYPTDAVVVSAYVSDPEGDPLTVNLFYRNGTSAYTSVAMTGSGHNGTYTATIPAYPAGSTISYYITANDTHNTTTSATYTYTVSSSGSQYSFIVVNAVLVETTSIINGSAFHINVSARLDGVDPAVGGTVTSSSTTSWLNGRTGVIGQNGYLVLEIAAVQTGTFAVNFTVSSQGLTNRSANIQITVEPSQTQHVAITVSIAANATTVVEGTPVKLSGSVLYEDNTPVPAGTIVTIGSLTATTDSNGNYSIEVTPTTTTTYLAEATVGDLYDNDSITITVIPAQTQHTSITVSLNASIPSTLEPGQTVYITGSAKYEDNTPAAGINITVEVGGVNKTGTTGTDGAFNISITTPQAEGDYRINVTASDGNLVGPATKVVTVKKAQGGEDEGSSPGFEIAVALAAMAAVIAGVASYRRRKC